MPRELTIRTPENVEVTLTLAGIGSRFMALLVDQLLQVLLILLPVLCQEWFYSSLDWSKLLSLYGWSIAATIFYAFAVWWGYPILFETLWNGQTPGKRMVGIRVIKANGAPIDVFAAAVRNLVRIIDILPGAYFVGLVTLFFSSTYQRVGDYAAGTVVVKEYRPDRPRKAGTRAGRFSRRSSPDPVEDSPPPLETVPVVVPENEAAHEAPEAVPGITVPSLRQVTRQEFEAARRYQERQAELPPSVSQDLARRIAEPILARLEMTPDDPNGYPYALFLETLVRDYLRHLDRY